MEFPPVWFHLHDMLYTLSIVMLIYFRWDSHSLLNTYREEDNLEEYHPKKPRWENPTGCSYIEEEVVYPKFIPLGKDIYVLSAFYDDRSINVTYIRILAIVPDKEPISDVFCHVRKTAADTVPIKAQVFKFGPRNSTLFTSAMFLCNVHKTLNRNPCKFHFSHSKEHSSDDNSTVINLLPLVQRKFTKTFGVCPPPVWGFIIITRFVEFIELSKLLGADQVFFYTFAGTNNNVFQNDQIERVMEYYDEHDHDDVTVTHYAWNLPVEHRHLWQYGRMLAMHHCLYTNMYKFKYLIFTDMDEFIIPHGMHSDWHDILNAHQMDTPNTGEYTFETAYFIPEVGENIISINSLFRTEAFDRRKTKFIIKPETVDQLGIYHVKKFAVPNTESALISTQNAIVHHYRFCNPQFGIPCQNNIKDATIEKYTVELKSKYKTAMTGILGYDAGLQEGSILGQGDY